MNVLEKILEEIEKRKQEHKHNAEMGIKETVDRMEELNWVDALVRYHMNDAMDTNVPTKDGWIPADSDNQPKDEERVLVSFENFNEVLTARYKAEEEGGTFLLDADDTDESFVSHDLYVSAWQPLPEGYKGE